MLQILKRQYLPCFRLGIFAVYLVIVECIHVFSALFSKLLTKTQCFWYDMAVIHEEREYSKFLWTTPTVATLPRIFN